MGETIYAVCDQCKLKHDDVDYRLFLAFLREHARHNFSGCRVVVERPYPTRETLYANA